MDTFYSCARTTVENIFTNLINTIWRVQSEVYSIAINKSINSQFNLNLIHTYGVTIFILLQLLVINYWHCCCIVCDFFVNYS